MDEAYWVTSREIPKVSLLIDRCPATDQVCLHTRHLDWIGFVVVVDLFSSVHPLQTRTVYTVFWYWDSGMSLVRRPARPGVLSLSKYLLEKIFASSSL